MKAQTALTRPIADEGDVTPVERARPIIKTLAESTLTRESDARELFALLFRWVRWRFLNETRFRDELELEQAVCALLYAVIHRAPTISAALEGGASVGAYLRGMIRYAAIDLHKRRPRESSLDDDATRAYERTHQAQSPEAMMLTAERKRVLDEALAGLPTELDYNIMLRYCAGDRPEEIAARFGLDKEFARRRVARNVARLKIAVRKRMAR